MEEITYNETEISDPVIKKALKAINEGDWQTMEFLRDDIRSNHIPVLVKYWDKSMSWPLKDGFVAILMDYNDDELKPIMEDALDSPTVETRAYAVCILTKDFDKFSSFLSEKGFVEESRVNAAVAKYRKKK